jgi:magnesium transporter
VEVIRNAGQLCKLHPLLMEDILNTGQRPKVEEFDNCIFVVLRMIEFDSESHRIVSEQLSLVLGESVLLTFQEQPGDVFEPVRERIRKQKGRVRYCGADYLAYSLLDAVVDNAISIIEKLGEGIEDLEGEILTDAAPGVMERIHAYKREMNFLSKSIRPAREMVMKIIHMENPMIREKTLPFFKDLYDLLSEATESIETYRDMLTDMMNLYNTHVNNRMNDIMKVLTVFAALFIPLTFIAGIYGTNFDYMPELRFRYGYFIFLGGLVCVAGGMIYYFKRKKWI